MLVRSSDADEIRQLVSDQDWESLKACAFDGLTLGGLAELACACWHWRRNGQGKVVEAFLRRFDALPHFVRMVQMLEDRQTVPLPREETFSAPEIEFFPLRKRQDVLDEKWWMFLDRFRRSLVKNGFSQRLAPGIAGAFNEMADNVGLHSASDDEPMAPGVAGFHVTPRQFTFVVADVGRGVLASLRENTVWAHLSNSTDALLAAACERATRRMTNKFGDGFNQVFQSLVDLNGAIRLRSGDGLLRIKTDHTARQAERAFCPALIGLAVLVISSRGGPPEEAEIPQKPLASFK